MALTMTPMLGQQYVVYWLYFSKDVFALDSSQVGG